MVEDSIVAILGYRNVNAEKTGAGYVTYTTDSAGYVRTTASVVRTADNVEVLPNTVWSAAKSIENDAMMTVEKGKFRSPYNLRSKDIGLLSHNALVGLPSEGSLLVNECSNIVRLSMTFDPPESMVRAIDGASLVRILQ